MLLQIICNLKVICFLHLVLLFSDHCKLIQTLFSTKAVGYIWEETALLCVCGLSLYGRSLAISDFTQVIITLIFTLKSVTYANSNPYWQCQYQYGNLQAMPNLTKCLNLCVLLIEPLSHINIHHPIFVLAGKARA